MAENTRLRRVTDLFTRGREIVLDEGTLVWVNKPNAFERDEADKDARMARQRRILSLKPGHDEYDVVLATAQEMDLDDLIEQIAGADESKNYLQALDNVRSDEDWFDKVALLERNDALVSDAATEVSAAELDAMIELNADYLVAVRKEFDSLMEASRTELRGESRDELVQRYVQAWKEMTALTAFERERWATQIYYGLRDCAAVLDGIRWDHAKCRHQRLLESRAEVRSLPDDLLERIEPVIRDLVMTPVDSGNSAAPTSSSASSEQPDAEAASTPSTQSVG